ncbi:MAG: hypothetical protein OHK0029_32870 [Armatimonadaceae bacterium]
MASNSFMGSPDIAYRSTYKEYRADNRTRIVKDSTGSQIPQYLYRYGANRDGNYPKGLSGK